MYIKNKPKKWGFKLLLRCGITGMIYDFIPYGGDDTFREIQFSEQEQSFGTWFHIYVMDTLRSNRVRGCPIKTERELKASGRSSYMQMSDNQNKVVIVQGYDNKPVLMCSSYVDAYVCSFVLHKKKESDRISLQNE
ncbi:hypothetical protein JTB14_000898 [Gonioctena quinquepunctata]|nr:hypothetical protein JTB14_000898 [Gonioctena quinquepunctata]